MLIHRQKNVLLSSPLFWKKVKALVFFFSGALGKGFEAGEPESLVEAMRIGGAGGRSSSAIAKTVLVQKSTLPPNYWMTFCCLRACRNSTTANICRFTLKPSYFHSQFTAHTICEEVRWGEINCWILVMYSTPLPRGCKRLGRVVRSTFLRVSTPAKRK